MLAPNMSPATKSDAIGSRRFQPVARIEHARKSGADEGGQVGGDVQIGAAHVQALPLRAGHEREDGEVHDDPDQRHDGHDPGLHLGRRDQPADRRVDDQEPDHHERDSVRLRGEDLRAREPERPPAAGRQGRCPGCEEREPERRGVGQHVARVREQGEGAGHDPEHDLGDHEGDEQPERQGEDAAVGA